MRSVPGFVAGDGDRQTGGANGSLRQFHLLIETPHHESRISLG